MSGMIQVDVNVKKNNLYATDASVPSNPKRLRSQLPIEKLSGWNHTTAICASSL